MDDDDLPQIDGLLPGDIDDPTGVAAAVVYQAILQARKAGVQIDEFEFLRLMHKFFEKNAYVISLDNKYPLTWTWNDRAITVHDYSPPQSKLIADDTMELGKRALRASKILAPNPQQEISALHDEFRNMVERAKFSNMYDLVLLIDKFAAGRRLDQDPDKMNRHTCLNIAHEVLLQSGDRVSIHHGYNTEDKVSKPVSRLTNGDREVLHVVNNSHMYVQLLPRQPPPMAQVAPADGMTGARLCASCQWRPTAYSSYW